MQAITIQALTTVVASLLCFLQTFPAKAQTASTTAPSVSQELETLSVALRATQQQVEQSQLQIKRMEAEIDRLLALLAAKDALPKPSATAGPPPAPTPATESSETAEDIDILKSPSAQQQRTKVESSLRFPVRLTGLVLFNSFVNQGEVDQIEFQPHLLVVPTGSLVAFPNRDPFFHNVFSLFNGRRFDLGLYETGATHSVPFNREGVSYIFCNIHPEMGAVILSLATPYFAVATQASVQLHQVPPGTYLLKVWAEDAKEASLEKASRRINVGGGNTDAGAVDIVLQPGQPHTEKFGKPYSQHPEGSPY